MRCILFALLVGCATTPATFRATDSSFRPSPGPTPKVYVQSNLHEMPREGIRSVGVIEVKVAEGSGMKRVIELAGEKGRELGCWIVVEHSAFERLKTTLGHGARAVFVHGSDHGGGTASPGALRAEFDCVVRAMT